MPRSSGWRYLIRDQKIGPVCWRNVSPPRQGMAGEKKNPTPAMSLASAFTPPELLRLLLQCSNVLNWIHVSLPHSSCFRWWSIGLLRYTHAHFILHGFSPQPHLFIFFTFNFLQPLISPFAQHCMAFIIIINICFFPHSHVLLISYKKKTSTCIATTNGQAAAMCPVLWALHTVCTCLQFWLFFKFN